LDKILLLSDKYRGIAGKLSNRMEIWQYCWDMILNHPFIGVGFRMSDKILESMVSTHNVYLMILLESGIIGSILFLLSIAMCLIKLWKKAFRHKEKTSLFYIGLLSGTMVFGMGERFLINIGNVSSLLLFFALFHAGKD
jgi:O-antigen ligase